MARRFLYLRNLGTTTSWDADPYLRYIDRIGEAFPAHLGTLASVERFRLPSASRLSFWHSSFTQIAIDGSRIAIRGMNDARSRRFDLVYRGVRRVEASVRTSNMPWLVMQELVVLRNGLLRHAFSDIRGEVSTIVAENLDFREGDVQ